MHYTANRTKTACRRPIGPRTKTTKLIDTVNCKRCLSTLRKAWGRLPSPAELAATEAFRQSDNKEA